MNKTLVHTIAGALVVMSLGTSVAPAQVPAPPAPPASNPSAPQFTAEQLDQMLAPIALYPDTLLGQILMASTYPLEVVQADRWLQDRNNAALKGDQLAAALDQQNWDPSVKALVPFPQILHMMDGRLDWTERLGDAFLASQPAVMDSVQRLRQKAQAAGKLRSTPQETVTAEGQTIIIEPPNPETVYVPVYDPSVVYGIWPYPAYPPYYFPDFFDGVIIGAFGFGWFGIPIIGPLWGWDHWDWGRHRIDIDRDRWSALNQHRPPIGGGGWEHDPSHRHGVPYPDAGTRGRFAGASGSPDARRAVRGFPTGPSSELHPAPGVGRPAAPQVLRPAPAPGVGRPAAPQVLRPAPAPRVSPTFESYGRGADVRTQADRGHASRMSMPSAPSRGAGAPQGGGRSAPSGGGRGGHR